MGTSLCQSSQLPAFLMLKQELAQWLKRLYQDAATETNNHTNKQANRNGETLVECTDSKMSACV